MLFLNISYLNLNSFIHYWRLKSFFWRKKWHSHCSWKFGTNATTKSKSKFIPKSKNPLMAPFSTCFVKKDNAAMVQETKKENSILSWSLGFTPKNTIGETLEEVWGCRSGITSKYGSGGGSGSSREGSSGSPSTPALNGTVSKVVACRDVVFG